MLKKIYSGALALFLGLLAVGFYSAPANADNSGNGKGEGHTPVTICHNGHLQTVDDDGAYNGHAKHEGDVFPDVLGHEVTEADCAASVPDPDPIIGSSQTVFPVCDVTGNYELITTVVTRASGAESITKVVGRPLTEVEVLEHCKPVPGDKPVDTGAVAPQEPVAVPEAPVSVPVAPVVPAVPAATPLADTGAVPAASVTTAASTELAYTGFDWVAAVIGTLALAGGIALLRLKNKLA